MARLFYPTLYVAILAVVAALWTERDDRAALLGLIGVGRVSAQSPDPFGYGNNGWSGQGQGMGVPGGGMGGPGMNGMGGPGMNGMGSGMRNSNGSFGGGVLTAPAISTNTPSAPAAWPNGAQVSTRALPPSQDGTGRPGTSISQLPPGSWQPPQPQQQPTAAPMTSASMAGAPMSNVSMTAPPPATAIPLPVTTVGVAPLGVVQPTSAQAPQPLLGMQDPTVANMVADVTSVLPELPVADPIAPPVTSVPPTDQSLANAIQLDSAKIIARVGTEVILAGEILGPIDERLAILAKGAPEEEVEKAREMLARQRLDQAIQTKLIIGEAKRKVTPEAMKTIDAKLTEVFEEKEIPKAIAKMKCKDRHELDQKLRAAGNSIERERRAFGEKMIAQDWVKQQVKGDQEVTHDQLLAFYLDHATEYDYETKVRWEQLMVRFASYPSKADAYAAIAAGGNRILAGERFSDVARSMSEGSTAKDGGSFAWTAQKNLSSEVLDNALFSLPVGQLSPIIEDTKGFHIIRVIERIDAGRKGFPDVQGDIRKTIKQERVEKQVHTYVQKLQRTSKIWTIFDGPDTGQLIPGAGFYTPPSETGLPAVVPQRGAELPGDALGPRYREAAPAAPPSAPPG